jgi:hypothetical protein
VTISVWDKIDPSVTATFPKKPSGLTAERFRRSWREIARFGDIVGLTLWVLVPVKLLIFDFDRYIAERLGSPFDWLVQFRFFVLLVVVAVAVLFYKRAAWVFLYAAFFLLIVVFWKIPRMLIWFRSWNLILALITILSSTLHKFRIKLAVRAAELLVCILALTTSTSWLSAVCACLLSVAVVYHYVQTVMAGIRGSKFSQYQQRAVDATTDLKMTEGAQIAPELRSDEVTQFDKEQIDKFTISVASGLLQVKTLTFYAAILRQYRRSHALVFLSAISYLWLFIQSAILLTLINYSVYQASPGQFVVTDRPSIVQFLYYSITALYGNTVPQISARGDVAVLIATATAIYGPIFLLSLGWQLFAGLRPSRDDEAFGSLIARLKLKEKKLSEELQAEYEVSPDEALRRLQEIGSDAAKLIVSVLARMPSDPTDGLEAS